MDNILLVIYLDETIWSNIKLKSFPTLTKDINCDVLVIGGGISGILIAHQLKKNNKEVVVVEMDRVGMKKTVKTTAFITALQDQNYHDLITNIRLEKTKLYLDSCLEAVSFYKKLSNELDFDFEEVSSYKYFNNEEELEKETKALDQLGFSYEVADKVNLPISFYKAIEFKNQGQMNPMKLIKALSNGLNIFENTKIIKIKNNCAYTENNKINAKSIVVATGFPFMKLKGLYSLKMYQNKSFVITCENTLNFKGNIIGNNDSNLYFRDYKGSLIIGGNDIKTGKFNGGYKELEYFVEKNIKEKIKYKWINQDCITLDGIPYIGRASYFASDLYVATGYNLWGMTSAMQASHLISDLICKKDNKYEKLFNPSRLYKMTPLFSNIGVSFINLIKINKNRCNHLGCGLIFDDENECFECPCHGSKFHKNGVVIDGPTIKKLKK
jgi:glycine/D-amino acid oxidase-like deaminating enzyme